MDILVALTILPAWMVGHFFIKYDPGPIEPKKELKNAIGFGVFAMVLTIIMGYFFSVATGIAGIVEGDYRQMGDFIIGIAGHASIEEFAKFVPLALYVYKRPFFNEETDGIIYFAVVGLTFGGIESLLYALVSGGAGIVVALLRLVLGLFLHAALTSFVGYFLAKMRIEGRGVVWVVLAFLVACLMHTLYNIGAYMFEQRPELIFLSAFVGLLMNSAMFVLYYLAGERDVQLGLAGPQHQIVHAQQGAAVQLQATNRLPGV